MRKLSAALLFLALATAAWAGTIAVLVEQDTMTLSVTVAKGDQPLTYQWYKNATAIPGETGPTLKLSTKIKASATYWVVVKNAAGTTRSTVVNVATSPNITTLNVTIPTSH